MTLDELIAKFFREKFTAAVLESQRLGLSLDEPTQPLPEDE